MKKSRRGTRNSNRYTLGCEIRNQVAAVNLCINTLEKLKLDTKTRRMLKICSKCMQVLIGISVMRKVEQIPVNRKLAKKLANYKDRSSYLKKSATIKKG